MIFRFNKTCLKSRGYLFVFYLPFLFFLNCKKNEIKQENNNKAKVSDTVNYVSNDTIDYSSEEEINERKKYIEFLKVFLSQKTENQSLDILNKRVEAAMEIYANSNIYKDENFTNINDELVEFVEKKNDLNIAESFYTSGLLESYGYFSIVDGHPINHFKAGAKLGSINCVKYLAIIYFERILFKHNSPGICDPVCMFHRGRNYIEENDLASLNKRDMLGFTSGSSNVLLQIINAHVNMKMSDQQILDYVLYLRTHHNPIFDIKDLEIKKAFDNLKTDSKIEDDNISFEAFENLLNDNQNIDISDVAELFTFNYPAYENDNKFLFWVKKDLEKKGVITFSQFIEEYNLDEKYGLVDFGSNKIYKGILEYLANKGDKESLKLLQE